MYACPTCKKAPKEGKYPRKWQWKTAQGLAGHRCWQTILEDRAKAAEREAQRLAAELEAWKARAAYSAGDRVAFVYYRVSAPTHETRFGRTVRVRYEELREYRAAEGEIVEIVPNGYAVTNRRQIVQESDIFANIETASIYAKMRQQAYDAAVEFAKQVR